MLQGIGVPLFLVTISSKTQRDVGIKLLANRVHIQEMTVLLADKMHEQESQHKLLFHTTIST